MTVYYEVFAVVFILLALAQSVDYPVSSFQEQKMKHTKSAKMFFVLAAVTLILTAGLRYYVGTDYGGYYHYAFSVWAEDLAVHLKQLDEPGIYLINRILSEFTSDGAVSIFVLAAFTIGLSLRSIYKNTLSLMVAGLLYLFLCWDGCFNAIRQAFAAAILINGYSYLQNKKFVKYALTVFLAFLFHKSALIMIVPYFVLHRKINFKNIMVLVLGAVVVLYSYDKLFSAIGFLMSKEYDASGSAYISSSINGFRVLVYIVPAVIFVFLFIKRQISESDKVDLNLLMVHAVAMLMASKSTMLGRIGIYTSPFAVIAISNLSKKLPKSTRQLLIPCMLFLYSVYWWYGLRTSGNLNYFQWIWQREM